MTLPSPDTPWSAQQHEWLQALGHDVLVLAPSAGIGTAAEPERNDRIAAATPNAARTVASVSPLLRALALAAGRSDQDPEVLATVADLAALRGSAAARRALWPRLRALRKRAAR